MSETRLDGGRIDRVLDRGVRGFALLAGVVLFGLMLLTVYSVIMRYVFNAPPFFTLDLSQMMLIPVVFFGLAYCGWTGGHIAVDLIGAFGRPGLVRWIDAGVRLACAALMGLLTWELVGLAADNLEYDDVTNLIEIPHFPFVVLMIVGSALYTLVLLVLMVRSIRGRTDPPGMSVTSAGLAGLAALFLLLAIRTPVAISMMLVGVAGIAYINGWGPAMSTLVDESFVIASNYELMVIPLFVLMGNFASISGMSRDLYNAAYAWVGHWRGGLASATIASCAGFAALSGSSVASAVTMGRVALPEMRRYHYDPRLATGCIAAGGTLGILIPPSTGFIIYAILTEESIGRLFLAGVLPGLLLTALFMVSIYIQTRINPELGPAGPRVDFLARIKTLRQATAMIGIVVVTIGGIYGGIFTPTEAAGVGALLAFLLALARGRINLGAMSSVLLQTIRTTALSFLILIGAHIFSPFLALTHIPDDLARLLVDLDITRLGVMLILMAAYIVLGTFLEGFAMLVLTLPIVHPLILALGYDPIWFGVMMVIVLEMGLISPPVGVNVFVVKGIADDVPLRQIFAGIIPFWIAMAVCLLILLAFPQIALYLPSTMIGT